MKDLETTWSHLMARKLATIRDQNGMTNAEIAKRMGVTPAYIGSVLGRQKKWTEENFLKIWMFLGIPEKSIRDMMHVSLLEAMEQEYGIDIAFALKTKFKLTDKGVRDVMRFLNDLTKEDN